MQPSQLVLSRDDHDVVQTMFTNPGEAGLVVRGLAKDVSLALSLWADSCAPDPNVDDCWVHVDMISRAKPILRLYIPGIYRLRAFSPAPDDDGGAAKKLITDQIMSSVWVGVYAKRA